MTMATDTAVCDDCGRDFDAELGGYRDCDRWGLLCPDCCDVGGHPCLSDCCADDDR